MLRIMKILLVLGVALWCLLGAFGNLSDWSGTTDAVKAVTSMTTIEGGTGHWRATTNPILITMGALFIMLSKTLAGLLCLVGARRMWSARTAGAAEFTKAKIFALTGCGVAVFMLFVGFIAIAETWYELWRSDTFGASVLSTAFRYAGMIMVIAIFVGSRDD